MSILVVNSLKNSAGSAPTLTIPTADGTDGQILQSSNNAGNLVFAGAQLEAQNGTNITFPASAADDSTFVTDANGALTATAAGTNPMNTPDNAHQGERLLDKYVVSGSAGNISQLILSVPTGYTNTDINTIRSMRVVMRGMQLATGGSYRPTIQLLEQDGTDYFTGGSQVSGTWNRFGVEGKTNTNSNQYHTASTQKAYMTRVNVYRSSSGASNEDYFSGTTKSYYDSRNASACFNSNIFIHCASMPHMVVKTDYIDNENQANYYNEHTYIPCYANLASGTNNGRHPMGVKITNDASNNWISGVVELYGTFKDGVVS